MTDLRKENDELKKKISILERTKEKYKREVVGMSGKIEEEKAKAGEKLMKERRNGFENYCIKKKIDLEKKYKDVDERNKLLKSEVKDLAEARSELEKMTLDLTNTNNELENRITSLASRNSIQEEVIKRLSEEKSQVEQRNQQLEDILAGSLKQCEDLKNKAKGLEQTIENERQRNRDEAQKVAKHISDLEEILRISNQHNSQMTQEINSLHQERDALKETTLKTAQEFEDHKSSSDSKHRDLESKYKDVDERNKLLQSEVKDLAKARSELEKMTLDLTNTNNELENRITSLCSRNIKVDQSNRQLEDILAGSLKQCEDLKNKAKEQEQTIENERQRNRDEAQKVAKHISHLEKILRISNRHNSRMTQEINRLHQEHDALKETFLKTTQELEYHKSSSDSKHRDLLPLPSDWELMPKDVNCKVYPVTEDAFSMVSRRFMETINGLQVRIIKVDRIQNKCLYKQYHLKKHQISLQSRSSNEKLLWHGTHGEAVYGITVNGFDRGYKGHNVGTIYGQGVYFSASSHYSVGYSKSDINNECHMFFARVLTGDSTLGKPEYKVPPIKDHSSYTRYDSLVNRTDNPGIYVVMNDTQAYPEFLVTYQLLSG